jgi:hypothetical protein
MAIDSSLPEERRPFSSDQQFGHRREVDDVRLERAQQVLVAVGLDLSGVEQGDV